MNFVGRTAVKGARLQMNFGGVTQIGERKKIFSYYEKNINNLIYNVIKLI